MAPQVGLEPTTTRLTAECSAIELLRNVWRGFAAQRTEFRVKSGLYIVPAPALCCSELCFEVLRIGEAFRFSNSLFLFPGNVLLSRAVSSQVPSALRGLTSVFGMGTGGSLSLLSPEISRMLPHPHNCTDQVFDLQDTFPFHALASSD